jgi:hypothetical protein
MKKVRSSARQRGTDVIKTIAIAGFWPPIIVEKGKLVKDWKDGVRIRLTKESRALEKLAKHMDAQKKSVSSIDIPLSPPGNDDGSNEFDPCEWLIPDEEESYMAAHGFMSFNDEEDFWTS